MFPFTEKKDLTLDLNKLPCHIAIIMDGNGRWASKRMLMKSAGHKAGAQALEKVSRHAADIGIKHLTVYAFSTENWKRSPEEVAGIMNLLRDYLQNYIDKAKKDNVKIDIIGDKTKLDQDIQEKIVHLENLTKHKDGMALHIALNYGGRDELVRAVKKLCEQVEEGKIHTPNISEAVFEKYLDTKDIPDPELLIRTSGEERISNFLLWQLAYSEFYFTEKLWPDFTNDDFDQAIIAFQNRDRRFGGR